MSSFFSKKKVIAIIIVALVTVVVGLLIGNNIANTMKAKEKQAEKGIVENQVQERNEIDKKDKIEVKQSENEDTVEKVGIEEQPEEEKKITEQFESDNSPEKKIANNYSEEYKKYLKLSNAEKAKVEAIPRKENIDYSELEIIKEDQKEDLGKEYILEDDNKENQNEDKQDEDKPKSDEHKNDKSEDDEKKENEKVVLPERFNLNEKIDINVEDQGGFGLCWDFAALKCVETNLALTQGVNYNLSESHVDYTTSNLLTLGEREANCGGNFSDMKKYNESYRGFATEEEVPLNVYDDYEYNTFCNTPLEDLYITKYVDFPAVNKMYNMSEEEYETKFKNLQTAVKTHIMNYGSVYATIATPNYGVNHYTKDKDDLKDNDGSHSISIVGWDDSYSKDNFISPNGNIPEKDGAYIALNSWGEEWANNGYFYISYEDFRVHREMSGVVSVNKKSDLINVNDLGEKASQYANDNYSNEMITLGEEKYLWPDKISYNLDLSNMEIEDISEFKDFIDRAYVINLSNNKLSSIEGLEKYIHVEGVNINLSNNNVKDVSCLKDLKIGSLTLDGNIGVKGYENLNITTRLSLENCGITAFRIEENYKNIKSLNLSGNKIEDYGDVANLKDLNYLELRSNGFTSLDNLSEILKKDGLNQIDLSHNNFKDISGLESTTISNVDLSYNTEIENFEPLRKSKKISTLYLKGCNINDAKDIVIESDAGGSTSGINYILSENKEISNLGALKNASTIVLENCNLGDISEIKELKNLRELDLSHNHGLTGDLSGISISRITLNDCSLNNDFNLFNINSVTYLDICGNEITNIESFINKVTMTLFMDSYDGVKYTENGVYISVKVKEDVKEDIVEIKIPNEDGLSMNFVKYLTANKIDNVSDVMVNGKPCEVMKPIAIDKNTTISYYARNLGNVKIKFIVDESMNSDGIEVMYNPYLARLKDAKELDSKKIRVANTYGNGIFKETDDFVLDNSNIYRVPAKTINKKLGTGSKTYIDVDEKYYSYIRQGDFLTKFTLGKMDGCNIIDE